MAASTVMTQDAWEAALSSGKYSKTWLTNTMKRMQDHETRMAMLQVLKEDPQMKFFLGAGMGSFVAVMGLLASGNFSDALGETWGGVFDTTTGTGSGRYKDWAPGYALSLNDFGAMVEQAVREGYTESDAATGWVYKKNAGMMIYIPEGYCIWNKTGEVITIEEAQQRFKDHQKLPIIGDLIEQLKASTDFFGMFNSIATIAGASFAGLCWACLLLDSTFSGTDLGELGSAFGAIVP